MPAASALSLSPCMASAVMAIIGGLLMSGRRLTSDSGEPDLWSNGSVFMGPREPISIDPSPHIPLQQTTVSPVTPSGVVVENVQQLGVLDPAFMDVPVSGSQHPEIEGAIVGHQGFIFEGIQQHL